MHTPGLMRTRRIYFSPRKFLISTREPLSWITTLMGKWAYTDRILYLKPYKTRSPNKAQISASKQAKDLEKNCIKTRIHQFYTCCPYQSYTLDHVLNMAANGSDCCQLLPVTPPFIHTQLQKQNKYHSFIISSIHSTNNWLQSTEWNIYWTGSDSQLTTTHRHTQRLVCNL